MSVYIHQAKPQQLNTFQPVIRSESDIQAERETLRNSIPNKENLDLITSFYGILKPDLHL